MGDVFYKSTGNTALESGYLSRSLAHCEYHYFERREGQTCHSFLFLMQLDWDMRKVCQEIAFTPDSGFSQQEKPGNFPDPECRSNSFDAQACCFLRQGDLHSGSQTGLLRGSLEEAQRLGTQPSSSSSLLVYSNSFDAQDVVHPGSFPTKSLLGHSLLLRPPHIS